MEQKYKYNISRKRVQDILYLALLEFENEGLTDYESKYTSKLTQRDYNIMLEFLTRYVNKINLMIEEL